MNYEIDELFGFKKIYDGYAAEYLKKDDPEITEVKIPAEFNGEPVTRICSYGFYHLNDLKRVVIPPSVRVIDAAAFAQCYSLETVELPEGLEEIRNIAFADTGLRSITLPKSLKRIFSEAFRRCDRLESVIFKSGNSTPDLGEKVFFGCHRLPADITLMGLVNSCDITQPLDARAFNVVFDEYVQNSVLRNEQNTYIRPDVFALAAKNDCFRSVDITAMLKSLIKNEDAASLRTAEEYGLIKTRELIDRCIEYSAELGKTEITAYLLDVKNRKFGFTGFNEGDNFEL